MDQNSTGEIMLQLNYFMRLLQRKSFILENIYPCKPRTQPHA